MERSLVDTYICSSKKQALRRGEGVREVGLRGGGECPVEIRLRINKHEEYKISLDVRSMVRTDYSRKWRLIEQKLNTCADCEERPLDDAAGDERLQDDGEVARDPWRIACISMQSARFSERPPIGSFLFSGSVSNFNALPDFVEIRVLEPRGGSCMVAS